MTWWARLFPYRTFLETEIERLRAENKRLLDRVLFIATGMSDNQPEISTAPLSPEGRAAVRKAVDSAADSEPFGGYPTFSEMLQHLEADSFQKDADRQVGPEIEPGASIINGREATSDEDWERRQQLRKTEQQALASVALEYKSHQKPVEVL